MKQIRQNPWRKNKIISTFLLSGCSFLNPLNKTQPKNTSTQNIKSELREIKGLIKELVNGS